MILDLMTKNIGTVIELLVAIGAGLIFLGKFRSDLSHFRETAEKNWAEINMRLTRLDDELEGANVAFDQHQKEKAPHSSCLVEMTRMTDVSGTLAELRRDIKRVEGWVIALANRQGIKEPRNGD